MSWVSGLVWDCLGVVAWVLSVQVLIGAAFFLVWTLLEWRRDVLEARAEGEGS